MLTPLEVAQEAVKALNDKMAHDIIVLKTRELTVLSDYFIICTAASTTQIKTLSDAVDKALSEQDEPPLHVEGYRDGGWVLVDFGCVVVHIFLEDVRKFYNLEHLWSDAPEVDIRDIISQ